MLAEEPDEILRLICGRIMRASEIEPEHFWPPGTESKLYNDFPKLPQDDAKWDRLFQDYVGEIFQQYGEPKK
jgi:hypothetical protein